MAARASMANLLLRLRDRIRDPAVQGQALPHFSDDELQTALDSTQQTERLLRLAPHTTLSTGFGQQWLTYRAPEGDWEEDATVQSNGFVLLTVGSDYTFDAHTGTVTLASSRPPPLYLNGQTYDLAAAAADLLERWAGDLDSAYDFQDHRARFFRSQQAAGKRAQAAQERRRIRVQRTPLSRGSTRRIGSIYPIYQTGGDDGSSE